MISYTLSIYRLQHRVQTQADCSQSVISCYQRVEYAALGCSFTKPLTRPSFIRLLHLLLPEFATGYFKNSTGGLMSQSGKI